MGAVGWERFQDTLSRSDTAKRSECWSAPATILLVAVASACGAGGTPRGGASPAEANHKPISWSADHRPPIPVEKVSDASGIFLLDGKPMCFVGSNNYYLIFKPQRMVDDVLDTAKSMGIKVFRHWAFTDRGSLDGAVAAMDGDGTKEGVYFQYWDSVAQKPAYNDGDNGLRKLDYLLYKARQNDIRIVMVLTNNWRDFGGMDQYLTWYGLSQHPQFYTDERVKHAYKDYVAHLVNRINTYTGIQYKDDPYIFSWGLANEPRMRNYTGYDSSEGWKPDTITRWTEEMSDFIRGIDPNHMISLGDEGFYTGRSGALYSGEDGLDHDGVISLPNIDYATFHLYPDHWAQGLGWGEQWVEDHLVSARRVGKPAVLEEYNVKVKRDDATQAIVSGGERRGKALSWWHERVQLRGGAGAMFWMLAGYDHDTRGYYRDYDHFTVYSPKVDVTGRTMQEFATRMGGQASACELAGAEPRLLEPRRAVPPGFVTTSRPEVVLELNRRVLAVSPAEDVAVPPSGASPPSSTRRAGGTKRAK